jgi:hypothetical protein
LTGEHFFPATYFCFCLFTLLLPWCAVLVTYPIACHLLQALDPYIYPTAVVWLQGQPCES